MQYKCKTISLARLNLSVDGMIKPLCQDCQTLDCSNLIANKKVSVAGEIKTLKLYGRGDDFGIVIGCEGFLAKKGQKN